MEIHVFVMYQAVNFFDMIDWQAEPCTEPPLTIDMSLEEITAAFSAPVTLPPYPNNTQSVERMVRVVTEVAPNRVGYTARHRFVYYYCFQDFALDIVGKF